MEATLLLAGENVPDNDGLWVVLVVGQRAEGHHVALTRREVDQLHPSVTELHDLLELFAAPQRDTLGVEGGQVGSLG